MTETTERQSCICQRENPFYVDTVKMFRDKRYEYKVEHKNWGAKLRACEKVCVCCSCVVYVCGGWPQNTLLWL